MTTEPVGVKSPLAHTRLIARSIFDPMQLPTPDPDAPSEHARHAVEQLALREFPDLNLADIMAVLDRYGTQPHEKEIPRVHLALLKLSNGRMDVLRSDVEVAKTDYRDILAAAEFPAEMALRPFWADRSNATEIARARREDRQQYREWLDGA